MVSEAEMIARLILASALGGAIGLEREIHGREAGIRTYLLVSLGSALIMIISEYLFLKYQGSFAGEVLRADPGRIAAQAVTGIGFLGAGVIIRYRNSIRGLTTAACMWVTCAVGLAIGTGYYLYGTVVAAITLFSLTGVKIIFRRLSTDVYRDLIVISEDQEGQFERLHSLVEKDNVTITNYSVKMDRQRHEMSVSLRLRFRAVEPQEWRVLGEVSRMPGIKSVELR